MASSIPHSGRTIFHLASTVSISLFEVELAAFAQQVGAGPRKQIVLVLDRAGWHSSVHLRVPEHVHLLFLPAYSPDLQPAEHLWALTNTALANRHFATIDALADTQAERCVALQARPDLIRSTTRFIGGHNAPGNDKALTQISISHSGAILTVLAVRSPFQLNTAADRCLYHQRSRILTPSGRLSNLRATNWGS